MSSERRRKIPVIQVDAVLIHFWGEGSALDVAAKAAEQPLDNSDDEDESSADAALIPFWGEGWKPDGKAALH